MTVLFLYTELADYFLKCCDELSKSANVHIVRWPVNKEAPFAFEFSDKIKIYEKHTYSLQQLKELVRQIKPDMIVCSGWVDKDYLKVIKPYYGKIPTVMSCDTHWRGDLKQQLARVLSRMFLLNTFSHGWVPGGIQKTYLEKLGFRTNRIYTGFYCCDLEHFNQVYTEGKQEKENHFPKVFLYVGRYYEFKGIRDLWTAFIELHAEQPNEWELWCLGNGNIDPVAHPKIKHFGFVQPKHLPAILQKSGVFVLPSRFEPWGVVVQEYAAAGFPILVSDAVGAKDAFVKEGENGFVFGNSDISKLKAQLKKFINISGKELNLMGDISHGMAQHINKQSWVKTLTSIYNAHNAN